MKKNYEKPLAKKVTFNYQKVVATSQLCIWHTPKTQTFEGCEKLVIGRMVNPLAVDQDGCGWMTSGD